MGNCLVTKLSESVDNAFLPKIGELFVTVKQDSTPNRIRVNHADGHKGGTARIVSGTGYFTDSAGTLNVQSINLNTDVSTELFVATTTDVVIAIPNKYYLTYLGHSSTVEINSREKNRSLLVNASDLDYANLANIGNLTVRVEGEFDVTTINPNAVVVDKYGISTTFSSLSGEGLYGDATDYIKNLTGFYGGSLREFFLDNDMVADLSQIQAEVWMVITEGREDKIFSWKTTRDSSLPIIALRDINLGNDVDAMLINQAACNPHSGVSGNDLIIKVYGTRTSASDAAVATLKSKGMTIIVNNVTL